MPQKKKTKQMSVQRTRAIVKKELSRNLEQKYIQIKHTLGALTATPVISHLTGTVQGTSDAGERVGDKITLRSYAVNMYIRQASISTTDPFLVRVILFQWNNTSIPNFTDVISNFGTGDQPCHVYNHDSMEAGILNILDDRVALVSGDNDRKQAYLRFSGTRGFKRSVVYPTSSISGEKGGLFLMYYSNNTFGVFPDMAFDSVVNYTDA